MGVLGLLSGNALPLIAWGPQDPGVPRRSRSVDNEGEPTAKAQKCNWLESTDRLWPCVTYTKPNVLSLDILFFRQENLIYKKDLDPLNAGSVFALSDVMVMGSSDMTWGPVIGPTPVPNTIHFPASTLAAAYTARQKGCVKLRGKCFPTSPCPAGLSPWL